MIVYGRNPVREALRGRRRVLAVWAATNAAREPWLEGVRVQLARGEEIAQRCGSEAHQGVCAEVDPYPYANADALLRDRDDADLVEVGELGDRQQQAGEQGGGEERGAEHGGP